MLIKTLSVGHYETNCYVVINEGTNECVVIDPGDESNCILDYIESNKLKCTAIFITHGHSDHTGVADTVAEELNVPVYINKKDCRSDRKYAYMCYDPGERGKYYDDGDTVDTAGMHFEIIATPGHTMGGVTIKCNDVLFTGDTLFKGSCGRVDLWGGDPAVEMESLKKLCWLEGDFEVYPGHMDSTTLERERMFNHYCREAMRS